MENKISDVSVVNDKDWFLEELISIVNKSELSFGITVTLGGMLVTGDLVGGKQYFESFAEDFSTAFFSDDEESKEKMKSAFEGKKKIYDGEHDGPIDYIHIKNAKFMSTDGSIVPSNTGTWWRGKLRDITGFTLGKMQRE